jgi:hypothetical protein
MAAGGAPCASLKMKQDLIEPLWNSYNDEAGSDQDSLKWTLAALHEGEGRYVYKVRHMCFPDFEVWAFNTQTTNFWKK